MAKVLDIPIIYFDFDKSNIRQDAEIEIQKIFEVLKKYPKMNIDIRTHTDCRGSYFITKTYLKGGLNQQRDIIVKKANWMIDVLLEKDMGKPGWLIICSNGCHVQKKNTKLIGEVSLLLQKCNLMKRLKILVL